MPKFGPPETVADANEWHEQHEDEHEDEYSACWCCCIHCELHNPHYAAAIGGWRAASEKE